MHEESTCLPSDPGSASSQGAGTTFTLLGERIYPRLTLIQTGKPLPSLGVLVGYGLAFYFVSLVFTDLPTGLVYGTWAGVGIVGIAIIGVIVFGEAVDFAGIVGITLIVAGVYILNVVSTMAAH